MEAARTESGQVAFHAGAGAEIFLMTRRFARSERTPDADPAGPSELSLHAPGGDLLADLGQAGSGSRATRDPALGLTVAVDPGGYLLRWSGGGGITVQQSVHAVARWQTQVFLLEEADHGGRHRVSVLMSRGAVRPRQGPLRAVEEARSALADERKVASAYLNDALFAEDREPDARAVRRSPHAGRRRRDSRPTARAKRAAGTPRRLRPGALRRGRARAPRRSSARTTPTCRALDPDDGRGARRARSGHRRRRCCGAAGCC